MPATGVLTLHDAAAAIDMETIVLLTGMMIVVGYPAMKLYRRVDWPLLVMFAGLFVVVHAFELHVVRNWALNRWARIEISFFEYLKVGVVLTMLTTLVGVAWLSWTSY